MSLTSSDFLMCLGSYINRIPGDHCILADIVSDKLLHSCVRLPRKVDYRSCGQPADRAFSPLLSFLFYSLLILLYLFISQTRQNQQHLNTTNANPGGLLQTRTQEVEDLVQPSNRGLLLQPSSRGLLLSAFVSGVFYGRQPIESGVFYRLE